MLLTLKILYPSLSNSYWIFIDWYFLFVLWGFCTMFMILYILYSTFIPDPSFIPCIFNFVSIFNPSAHIFAVRIFGDVYWSVLDLSGCNNLWKKHHYFSKEVTYLNSTTSRGETVRSTPSLCLDLICHGLILVFYILSQVMWDSMWNTPAASRS